jgi:hypothetical protein
MIRGALCERAIMRSHLFFGQSMFYIRCNTLCVKPEAYCSQGGIISKTIATFSLNPYISFFVKSYLDAFALG